MTTPKYCYSTDNETFGYESIGELLDYLDNVIGATYWRGEKQDLTHAECIDVDSFLEMCDERAYEEIGDVYDSCFADVTEAEKTELSELITAWAEKHVKMRYWRVLNVKELKVTAEDVA